MLVCLCGVSDADKLASAMLKYTTSFGIRRVSCQRYMLDRRFETVETAFGPVHKKTGQGYGVEKSKFEYEDAAAIAKKKNMPVYEVLRQLTKSSL